MEKPASYCEYVNTLEKENIHKIYHYSKYSFPILSENELFGRLILEINQANFSRTTILKNKKILENHFQIFLCFFKHLSFWSKDLSYQTRLKAPVINNLPIKPHPGN